MTLTEIRKLYEQVAMRERERLPELKARQSELSTELASVNAEIEAIEGVAAAPAPAAPARRGRAKKVAAKAKKVGRPRKVKPEVVAAAPKRRGRPPKAAAAKAEEAAPAEKKRPGRQRKVKDAGAEAPRPRRGRPRKEGGEMTLRQAISSVLSDANSPLAPSQIRDLIIEKNLIARITPSFHQQVTGTLSRNPEFKRIGKGKYSL